MKAFPTRTAAFVRQLSDTCVPFAKLQEAANVVYAATRWQPGRDDYTEREREFARSLGPLDDELDELIAVRCEALASRLAESQVDRARWLKEAIAIGKGEEALKARISALEEEVAALRKIAGVE